MMVDWATVAGYGLHHWIFFVISIALLLGPIGIILKRIGFSPLWALVALFPPVTLIALWMLALVAWPEKDNSSALKPDS